MKMGEAGRTIYLAIIGLGGRGCGQMKTLLQMPDVKVRVVCDVYQDRIENAQTIAEEIQGFKPEGDTDYKRVVARDDIDAFLAALPMAIRAGAALDGITHVRNERNEER